MTSRVATVVAVLLLVVAGGLAVLAGSADDSPGLQGIGVLLVLAALALVVRRARRPPASTGGRS